MLAPVLPAVQYEVWLYAKPGFRAPVQECGLFTSEKRACEVGALVCLWLNLGVFGDELTAAIPNVDDRDSLRDLPDWLRTQGIDPNRVLVAARNPVAGDNHAPPDGYGMFRVDAGHGGRGPVGENVDVTRRW